MKIKKTGADIFRRAVSFMTAVALVLPNFAVCSKDISVQAAEKDVVYGDVNSDGVINIIDMIMLKSYITEKNTKGFSVKAADVDDDGEVSAKDVSELCMYLLSQIGSFSYEMNIDTDGDGICDYIEKEILGTDYKSKDTDGDGLDDYAEVYLCNTDPLNAYTGDAKIKDSDSDADGDGLTNAEEINLGTSPALADTDEDGLSDYDEVKKHKTDPLKEDTDGDGISDKGEIKLGLDPLKVKSDGKTSDADRVFEQNISEDNLILNSVNNETNDFYKLSVNVKNSGYIEEISEFSISRYSNYLNSEMICGEIIDIDISEDFVLEELTLNFKIDKKYNSENFLIFKYSEEINMIVPVDTVYNGNVLSVTDNCTGTYCLVDIDKWSVPSEESNINYMQKSILNNQICYDIARDNSKIDEFEVYFLMYSSRNSLKNVRSIISDASMSLIQYAKKNNKSIKLYYLQYDGIIKDDNGIEYLDNYATEEKINSLLAKLKYPPTDLSELAKYPLIKQINNINQNYIKENISTYCYLFNVETTPPVYYTNSVDFPINPWDKSAYDSWDNMLKVEEDLRYYYTDSVRIAERANIDDIILKIGNEKNVTFSLICDKENKKLNRYKANILPDGKEVWFYSDACSDLIINEINGMNIIVYNVNIGFCNEISYNENMITEQWKDIYEKFYSGKMTSAEVKALGLPDSDGDGICDCLEINMKYISFDKNGNIILPTYDELAKDALKNSIFGMKGLDELVDKISKKDFDISKLRILPLISNIIAEDSDGDGIHDSADKNPSKSDIIDIDDKLIDDSKIFDDDYKTVSGIKVDGNGVVSSNNDEKRNNVIRYTRVISNADRSVSKFTLEPEMNSDYLITVDTGINDDCNIEVYYNTGLFSKTKNYVNDIPLDDGIAESEVEGNIKHSRKAYELKEGKTYHIDVTGISNGINSAYDIIIQQNNWISKPDGAIVDYSQPKSIYKNTIIYMPYYVIRNIIEKCYENNRGDRLETKDFDDKTKEQNMKSCEDYAECFIDCYKIALKSDDLSFINDLNTTIGVITLLSEKATPMGIAATLYGGYLVGLSQIDNIYKNQIKNALYEGKYNIQMLITEYYRTDYPSYKQIYESYVDWLPWFYNNGYINKYHSQTRYSEYHNMKANSIEDLKYYTPIKNENNEWELIPYEFEKR